MPVLSESVTHTHGASCSFSPTIYMLAGCAILLIGGILLRGKIQTSRKNPHSTSALPALTPISEKVALIAQDTPSSPIVHVHPLPHSHSHPHPPRPVSELPFTPPKLFTQSFEPIIRRNNQDEETVPSNEYYDSPTEMGFSSFDSFEQPEVEIPRRRSYTKTSSNGSNVSGEIIQVSLAVSSSPPLSTSPSTAELGI